MRNLARGMAAFLLLGAVGPKAALPPGYVDTQGLVNWMEALAAENPSICQLVNLTATYDLPHTFEHRPLWALKISDRVATEEDEPAILIVGGHHPNEIVTPVIALVAAEKLIRRYGIEPVVTGWVDENEIWIAPLWNPDGYDHVFYVDNQWHKNRRVVPGGIGIDLNRNYPFGWSNACSGSSDPTSWQYKGPAPASETETQTMLVWSEDQRFDRILDLHSCGQEVVYGYDCWSHPFDDFLGAEAEALSYAAGYGGAHRGPHADGEHYQWQMASTGCLALLIETHTTNQPSYSSALQEAEAVWSAVAWMLSREIPLWGHVTDGATGAPLEARIELEGVGFEHGETLGSGRPYGRYHAFLPPGIYDVRVEAEGYEPRVVADVVVPPETSVHLDVALTNPASSGPVAAARALDLAGPTLMRGRVELTYEVGRTGHVRLRVLDPVGREVFTVVNGQRAPGRHTVTWGGRDCHGRPVPAGHYYCLLESRGATITRSLLMVR